MKDKYILNFYPGNMSEEQFWLLVELSPIHSKKIISALRDFLVDGCDRKDIYKQHNISAGYFSGALGRLRHVSMTIAMLLPYYMNEKS
ncbi:TPA: transcriptional regulator [Escherichia coli]|nr:transcriptional regulator [Escherichia coli]